MENFSLQPTDIAKKLQQVTQQYEDFVSSAVVQQKKLQYAIYQLRCFTNSYSNRAPTLPQPTQEQKSALAKMLKCMKRYKELIQQNMLHCWAHTAIESSSVNIAAEICDISRRLNIYANVIDSEDAHFFDPSDPKWLQYHLMDLQSIRVSFNNFMKSQPDINERTKLSIEVRLKSIDNFFKEYDNEETITSSIAFSIIPINYKPWTLNYDDIVIEKPAGSGISSDVYYGYLKSTKEKVAIKKMKFEKMSAAKFKSYQREVMVLGTVMHPTLLKFVGATETVPFCIVTEWMKDSLYNELHREKRLTPTQYTIIAYDVARGMNYLHSHQMIHRDLKSLNILVNEEGRAKICDFGLTKKYSKNEIMTRNVGTPHWMAPELFIGYNYDSKVDVYSYGIVLWEILTKKTPYKGIESKDIIRNVIEYDERPRFPGYYFPEDLEIFINSCWARNPEERPTFSEIIEQFRTGKIYFPGTDIKELLLYIENTLIDDSKESLEIQQLLSKPNELSVDQFIYSLKNSSIPQKYVDELWNYLLKIKANYSDLSQCYIAFLKTSKALKASEFLRNLPINSVSGKIMSKIFNGFPTGNEKLDDNLIIAACRNNAAEEAVIHSMDQKHFKIGIDVISRKGIQPMYKDSIIARCILALTGDNDNIKASAFRCLISLNETKRLTSKIIINNLKSGSVIVKNTCYIVIWKMVQEGFKFPLEFVEALISISGGNVLSVKSIASICKDINISKAMLEKFQNGFYGITYELVIDVLKQSLVHESLRPLIHDVLNKFKIVALEEYIPEIEKIEKSLKK